MRLKTWVQQLFSKDSGEVSLQGSQPTPDVYEGDLLTDVPGDSVVVAHAFTSDAFSAGWATDVGKVRSHNEDGMFVFLGEQQSSDAVPNFGLFVLADGMGGHQAGEAASALASRVVAGHLMSHIYLPMLNDQDRVSTQPSLTEVISDAIAKANRMVSQLLPGSGTTLTCGMVLGGRLFVGHVGDSRAYLRSEGENAEQLTQDHSVVSKLVEIGQLTPEEAAVHPQRNMLYRAVGQGAVLDVDVLTHSLRFGDKLLLCSDGLWGVLSGEEMWRIVDDASTLADACAGLIEAANAAGGNDNISVILVKILRS